MEKIVSYSPADPHPYLRLMDIVILLSSLSALLLYRNRLYWRLYKIWKFWYVVSLPSSTSLSLVQVLMYRYQDHYLSYRTVIHEHQ
jgi:hypothetical protein